MPEFVPVYVHGLDSCVRPGQHGLDELVGFAPVDMYTVGWLIREEADCLIVAMDSMPSEMSVRDLAAIPKQLIKTWYTLVLRPK